MVDIQGATLKPENTLTAASTGISYLRGVTAAGASVRLDGTLLKSSTGVGGIFGVNTAGTSIVSSAIHYAHLSNYGAVADGTDSAAALALALASGKPVLIDGHYTLLSKVEYSGATSIKGNGPKLSSLTWTASATTVGVKISTVGTAAKQYIEVDGVGFFTGKTIGTGLELDYSSTAAVVNNIEVTGLVRGCTVSGSTQNTYYFDEGIKISNCKNVIVENNYVIGGGGTSAARTASHGIYFAHVGGGTAYNNHNARITQNTVIFCETGCDVHDVEGVFVTINDFQACNYGLVVRNTTQQKNQVRVIGNHIDGTHASITMTSVSFFKFVSNEIYCLDTNDAGLETERAMVVLTDVSAGQITNNTIRNADVTNVRVGVDIIRSATLANCSDVFIDHNHYQDVQTETRSGANCVRIIHGMNNTRSLSDASITAKFENAVGTSRSKMSLGTGGQVVPSGQSPTLYIDNYQQAALGLERIGSGGATLTFYQGSALVGYVSCTESATTYNTSSDYRLKEDVTPLVDFVLEPDDFSMLGGALLRTMARRPVAYRWRRWPELGWQRGYIAHELAGPAPQAVSGEKDAVTRFGTATFEDGSVEHDVREDSIPNGAVWQKTKEIPEYQGVDHSKVVPDIDAGLQELTMLVLRQQRSIEGLVERIGILEAR